MEWGMRVQNRMCWNGRYWNTVYQVKFNKNILIFYYWIFISWALVHQISTVYFHGMLLPLFRHSFIIAYHLNFVCQSSNSDNAWHARHNKTITAHIDCIKELYHLSTISISANCFTFGIRELIHVAIITTRWCFNILNRNELTPWFTAWVVLRVV